MAAAKGSFEHGGHTLTRSDWKDLLRKKEGSLYCILGDPGQWFPPSSLTLTGIEMAAFKTGPSRALTEEERNRGRQLAREKEAEERKRRADEHRRAGRAVREWAAHEQDQSKRSKFERSAQLNDAFADTLERMSRDVLEDIRTAFEKRVDSEAQLRTLGDERKRLEAPRWIFFSAAKRGADAERLRVVRRSIREHRQLVKLLAREEAAARKRSEAEWAALNEAKCMVAEEHGRAKFRELEPDIRTRLCEQWRACEQVKKFEDEVALTMAIGDVLMTLGATLPIASISVLVVKIGVKKFCNCPS